MDFILIKRTFDKELIHETVMSMIDDIIEDDTNHNCFVIDVESDCWLECNDDEFVGLFHLSPFNRTVLDMHCYLLKNKRSKSKKYGEEALAWVKNNAPKMYSKIITQSPYIHIKRWLLSLGFEQEGCYKKSFTKNGELLDLNLFGLSRDLICQK